MDMIISKSWTLWYRDEVQPCESTTLYFTVLRALVTESAKLKCLFYLLSFLLSHQERGRSDINI